MSKPSSIRLSEINETNLPISDICLYRWTFRSTDVKNSCVVKIKSAHTAIGKSCSADWIASKEYCGQTVRRWLNRYVACIMRSLCVVPNKFTYWSFKIVNVKLIFDYQVYRRKTHARKTLFLWNSFPCMSSWTLESCRRRTLAFARKRALSLATCPVPTFYLEVWNIFETVEQQRDHCWSYFGSKTYQSIKSGTSKLERYWALSKRQIEQKAYTGYIAWSIPSLSTRRLFTWPL